MKAGEVVARLLWPTDQQATESVHPAVRALDDPTSSAKPGIFADFQSFLTARHGDALAAYLLMHVGARSDGQEGQVLLPRLSLIGARGSEELHANSALRTPTGVNPRSPKLLYDAITHEVHTYRVQVFLRNDCKSDFVGAAPLLLGELNHDHNELFIPLGQKRAGSGFVSLFEGGLSHIAEGTDHLLCLMLLLLVAPLLARDRRWNAMRPLCAAPKHTPLFHHRVHRRPS